MTSWSSMARTNCRMGPRSIPAPHPAPMPPVEALRLSLALEPSLPPQNLRAPSPGDPPDESITAVHSAAGRHHPLDGWRPPRRLGRLPAIAHLCLAAGRLPHNSSTNLLSRRQPGRHGFLGHRAPRAPIRPDSRPESDDLHEFLWQLDYHSPIRLGL